jgi:hypothetical protein
MPGMSGALFYWAMLQAAYYVVTGIWPIVHMPSFLAVTGPKVDLWLVRTIGALVTVIGATIGLAAWNGRITGEIAFLAVGSAAALGAVDVIYVAKRVIPRIYLADALAEVILIAGWFTFWPARSIH